MQRGWNFFRPERNESFDILPASQRVSETQWYAGTADAVFQNIDIIQSYGPSHLVILAGDHIYKMDYELMLQDHANAGADVTVGCLEVPRMEATGFGVMHVDQSDRIMSFIEKPKDPPATPGNPDLALASMGIYVFETKFLADELRRDAADPTSSHDFGKDIIPHIVKNGKAFAHRFAKSCVRSAARDRGLLARRRHRRCLLGNQYRPHRYRAGARSLRPQLADLDLCRVAPPAKFVHDEDGRRGTAISSLVAGGCIVSGASVHRSLLRPAARPLLCRTSTKRWSSLTCRSAAVPGSQGGRRPRRAHPRGPGRRRGPEDRHRALPAHRERRLPDDPAHDQQAQAA